VDGEVVAMRFSDGLYLSMDQVGSEVWGLIAEPVAFGDLCRDLATRFAVDADTCAGDVAAFLEGLQVEGMVDVTAPG
jgi:hypothetical protein